MLQANNQIIELEKIKNQQLDLIDQAAAQNALNITERENQRVEEKNQTFRYLGASMGSLQMGA